MFSIELVLFIVMIAVFAVLLVVAKLPSGISLMIAAVIGWVASYFISGTELDVRFLIEGGFGYLDSLLVIIFAMIFIKGLEASGGLDYLSALLVKVFHKFPTILLILFMTLLLLPGMVTGSSTAAVVSIGIVITPIMIKMGIPKAKVAGFVGMGAILGMVAPPINIPVMVICDVVDIAYSDFELPLLILTIPVAIFTTIIFSRNLKLNNSKDKDNKLENIILSALLVAVIAIFAALYFTATKTDVELALEYFILFGVVSVICIALLWIFKPYCANINMEEMEKKINFNIFKEIKWYCLTPLLLLVILFILQSMLPRVMGVLGTPLLFIIAFIPTLFTGKKFSMIKSIDDAVKGCLGVLGLLMGVGMFIEIMSLSGAKASIVINVLALMCKSPALAYVALGISMPLFGGISSFASASVFGGPFVMALYTKLQFKIIASGCSLLAAIGEFLPPTALSARLAAKNINDIKEVGEEDVSYMQVTKSSIYPLVFTLVWSMIVIIIIGANFHAFGGM